MQKNQSIKLLAIIGLLLTNVFWTGNIYVSRLVVESVPPFSLNVMRWLLAAILLTPFAWRSCWQDKAIIWQHRGLLLVFSLLGVTIYNGFLYTSAHTTSGINIAVISTLTPVITFFFVWVFFRVVPSRNQCIGLLLGLSGVLLLVARGDVQNFLQLRFVSGDLWMMAAVVAWAAYTALLKKKADDLRPIVFLYVTIVVGTCFAMPTALWEYQQTGDLSWLTWQWKTFGVYVYVGIFPSIVAYLFFNYGANVLGPNMAATFAYLLPVLTALVSVFLLSEELLWFHLVGQVLVFLGFYFSLRGEPAKSD